MDFKDFEEKKFRLIEKLGLVFENKENLPPLAARIKATIIMYEPNGLTFDDLIAIHKASKSTVSTSLNLLTNLNKITYYTKPGDRKRYYTVIPKVLLDKIESSIKDMQEEKKLHDEIKEFKIGYNNCPNKNTDAQPLKTQIHDSISNYFAGVIELLKEFKQNIEDE
ncbi:hypothetical protein R9C00_08650 [Flammeovirgaceae bacterium SG7u.111]|nr:hypothetical protein [Flammeovirgaceae bacterium SG7u.132]WPO37516.1 hypothetical protein R9C00_08650 [Flammeovirgaceae bacterium SG7u.111]